ncbi:MAG: ATP-binding cassette domain-containing protein [Chitinispirillaceae bacterium]|nr:ATP-binding cassette domain-containing protein [Chitinispirillaceae bacterium]
MNVYQTLLSVTGLKTHFEVRSDGFLTKKKHVRAVDGVDFTILRGKTLGLVGESGCGKTTVGRTILGLVPATSGTVRFDGNDLFSLSPRQWRQMRRRMQIVFQDPLSSLDPRMTLVDIVEEPLLVHGSLGRRERRSRVAELLERVGLSSRYLNRYPHEFSGGQRQRIGIARALASDPDFIVCDEPVSALDVSIQAQILNLLDDLQKELGIAYLFIAHNLAVVEHFADEVAVMYLGKIVEKAGRDELYSNPLHPYTKALLSAVPQPDPRRKKSRLRLGGETPSPVDPPRGCAFHPRCALTRELAKAASSQETREITDGGEKARIMQRCALERPALVSMGKDPMHTCACFYAYRDQ